MIRHREDPSTTADSTNWLLLSCKTIERIRMVMPGQLKAARIRIMRYSLEPRMKTRKMRTGRSGDVRHYVGEALNEGIHPSPEISADYSQSGAQSRGQDRGHETYEQRYGQAEQKTASQITPHTIGPHETEGRTTNYEPDGVNLIRGVESPDLDNCLIVAGQYLETLPRKAARRVHQAPRPSAAALQSRIRFGKRRPH